MTPIEEAASIILDAYLEGRTLARGEGLRSEDAQHVVGLGEVELALMLKQQHAEDAYSWALSVADAMGVEAAKGFYDDDYSPEEHAALERADRELDRIKEQRMLEVLP